MNRKKQERHLRFGRLTLIWERVHPTLISVQRLSMFLFARKSQPGFPSARFLRIMRISSSFSVLLYSWTATVRGSWLE